MRMSDTWLRHAKPQQEPYDATIDGRKGLIVRVEITGLISFRLRYSRNGKRRWFVLGNYGREGLSLEAAYEMHRVALQDLSAGLDPKDEHERRVAEAAKAERRRKHVQGITIRNVIAEWGWHYARRQRKRPREALRLLKVNVGEPWKDRPIAELTRRDAVTLLDRIVARGSPVMANRIRDLSDQAFTFCVARELIDKNPFLGVPRPGGEETSSERWLTRDEVKTFWEALEAPEHKITHRLALGIRLILVTAQRPGEISAARISEFDLTKRVWTIPPEHIKTEPAGSTRAHLVPLNDLAIEIVKELAILAGERPCLLPGSKSVKQHDAPIDEKTLAHVLSDLVKKPKGGKPTLFGLEPFSPHDLRRTASTHMTTAGVTRFIVGKVLNHRDNEDTTAVYDRYEYWTEKQQALETWEKELRAILAGKKPKARKPQVKRRKS